LFSQDVWGGISVATPDNLNAISSNPAGLGINRGKQSGIYIPFTSVFTIYKSSRFSGFGYDLKYEYKDGNFPNMFNPSSYNIGFGKMIFSNFYAGIKFNKSYGQFIDLGLLYRPQNLVSFGLTSRFDESLTFNENYYSIIGLAVRPLLNHKLTLGADIKIGKDNNNPFSSDEVNPYITYVPTDGITLSFTSSVATEKYQFNMSFNFGKHTIYSPTSSTPGFTNEYTSGIGYYKSKDKQKSIFNKISPNKQQYIRIKLDGLFIEEKPYEPFFNFNFDINPFSSKPKTGIQLRTWIDKIDKLASDNGVHGLIIDMGRVQAGFAKRGEIYSALERFKNTGKTILVYADKGISNYDYHLISMADKIFLNEYSSIELAGLKIEISFFRGLLDTLLIVPEVFRVNFDGKSYKTAADQLLNKTMSDEMRENYGELLDDWFNIFVQDIASGRKWDINHTQNIIDNGPYFIPEDAISAGLADSIMYPDQFTHYLNALNDKKVNIIKWKDLDHSNLYVHDWSPSKKEKIAVIYAVGGIVSGNSNPGPAGSSRMGDKTIIKAIKSARENKDIKAIVLRIDSGGGSALASDQMWREVVKTTKEDSTNIKPFIASMSDVAASGGYYIACQADTIVAHPATVTGSIGVIGLRLNLSKLLNKFGITSDVIKKGEFSDFASGTRLIKNKERKKIQSSINDVYEKFKNRVIAGRDNIDINSNLDDVAMGRVFSGKRAKNDISIPLIDVTGGFHDSIELAKSAAGISGNDEIEIVEYPQTTSSFAQIFNKSNSTFSTIESIKNTLPEEISNQFEILDMLPIIMDDKLQMLIPYQINLK
tara:strand:- start:3153 stop:5612 length:2460 start_codon:yes stop_codon:yes gene_type:complete